MELQTLKHANYLDIIFYNRNKKYGSYLLRKYYGKRLGKAVAILYSALTILILISVFYRSPARVNYSDTFVAINPILIEQEKRPPLPPKQVERVMPAHPKINTKKLTDLVITDDPIPDDKYPTPVKNLIGVESGISNTEDTGDISMGVVDESRKGKGAMPIETKPDKPFIVVGQMPIFDGDIMTYLGSHVRYPDVAKQNGIEGRVIIEFVVNEDGAVSNTRVARGIGGGCDEEALRVVSGMPKWKPGKHNGIAVKVYFNLAIKFELQ